MSVLPPGLCDGQTALEQRRKQSRVNLCLPFAKMLLALIELQRLKNLDRTGWTLRGLPPRTESVAWHSFGVGVTAMLLADELAARGIQIDIARMLRMALLHDWSDARIGDMPKTATEYFGSHARKRAELAAFADIVKESEMLEELLTARARIGARSE